MLHIDEVQRGPAWLRVDQVATPIGTLHLAAVGDALCAAAFGHVELRRRFGDVTPRRAPLAASDRIRAYFEGDLNALDDLPVDPGGTGFQRAVWALLRKIPAGETRTYGQLAAQLGSAARAVGAANGANPVGLVIPCHRVIATGGALTGYAWGIDRKRWLLDHERRAP
jgi:methylated-DNA-[protein]-cysteine S-methyltransferase